MVAWVSWLLLQYYREWISLRQSYERLLARAASPILLLDMGPGRSGAMQAKQQASSGDEEETFQQGQLRTSSAAPESPTSLSPAQRKQAADVQAAAAAQHIEALRQESEQLLQQQQAAAPAQAGRGWLRRRAADVEGGTAGKPALPAPPALHELGVLPGGVGVGLPNATYAQRWVLLLGVGRGRALYCLRPGCVPVWTTWHALSRACVADLCGRPATPVAACGCCRLGTFSMRLNTSTCLWVQVHRAGPGPIARALQPRLPAGRAAVSGCSLGWCVHSAPVTPAPWCHKYSLVTHGGSRASPVTSPVTCDACAILLTWHTCAVPLNVASA